MFAMTHPQPETRGMLDEHDGLKRFAPSLKMSGLDSSVCSPAPKVGADGTAPPYEAGYTGAEIEALRTTGVI